MASAVVLSMVLVGCGSSSKKETEIALITDSGGINDKSFNQSAWEAVKEYGTKNDKGYKYYKPASFDTAGYKDQIKNAVDNGAKVVVLPGFKFAAALGTIQNEKKYKDVAEEMQVSVNTVKTQLARALKLLRENLNREDFELFLTFFVFSY